MTSNRTVIIYGGELYHHGILGMKWGKKNGPPYPLDAEDHSASEKKAGWKKSLSNAAYKVVSSDRYQKTMKKLVSKKNKDLRDKPKKVKGLSGKQKKALAVTAVAVSAGLAAYGAYKLSGKNATKLYDEYNSARHSGEAFMERMLSYSKRIGERKVNYGNTSESILKDYGKKYNRNIYVNVNRLLNRPVIELPDFVAEMGYNTYPLGIDQEHRITSVIKESPYPNGSVYAETIGHEYFKKK